MNNGKVSVNINGVSKGYEIVENGSDKELHQLVDYTVTNTASSASYVWTYDADTTTWTSGNKGHSSSNCSITISANKDMTVVVTYWASSENAEKWDYFSISKNGTKLYTAGGSMTAAQAVTQTITLKAGDVLVLKYEKDGTTDSGADQAYITQLLIDGVQYVG